MRDSEHKTKLPAEVEFPNNSIHVLSRSVLIDQDYILLCKTVDLPINFYFLPGGHIEHGESASPSL